MHACARVIGVRDRIEDDLSRLRAVDAVRVDGLVADSRRELVDELLAGRAELLDGHAGDREEGATRVLNAGLVDRALLGEPVGHVQLDGLVVAQDLDLVLDHLGAILVGETAEEDAVRPVFLILFISAS